MKGKCFLHAVLFMVLTCTRLQAQQRQGLQLPPIPPGSLVSLEIDVEPPPPGQSANKGGAMAAGGAIPSGGQSGAGGGSKPMQPGMVGAPSGGGQAGAMGGGMGGAGGAMAGGGGAMPGPIGGVPAGIAAQARVPMPMAMPTMRSLVGDPSMAPPGFEEPCKCEVECCQMPSEPRRPLPILHLPMVFHYGCCGCTDCPPSLNPFVSFRIRYTMMMMRSMGMRPGMLNSEGEPPDMTSK